MYLEKVKGDDGCDIYEIDILIVGGGGGANSKGACVEEDLQRGRIDLFKGKTLPNPILAPMLSFCCWMRWMMIVWQ